jgi:predicted NBD/HSP70 family sugar kinase
VIAERVDPYGDVTARTERPISRPARPDDVAAALESAVTALHPAARDEPDGSVRPPGVAREPAAAGGGSRPRLAVVSAADPVDRATGRLLQLPDAPFLLGTLDPVAVLGSHVDGPVTVDNDVNWAARAEREQGGGPADSAYLYLGEGLGCAVISDGEVRRGAVGLAGELAHLVTIGPDGRATRLIEVFAQLGLRRAGTTAIDVERLITAAEGDSPTVTALAQAVGGVIAAIVALADPEVVILGGPWGSHPAIALAVTDEVAGLPRPLPIQVAALTGEPSLTGARVAAIEQLRSAIVAMAR